MRLQEPTETPERLDQPTGSLVPPPKRGEPYVMEFSETSRRKLTEAFDGLFTDSMRVVAHIDGAADAVFQVSGEVRDGAWRSPELEMPRRGTGRVIGMSAVNARGEIVGSMLVDPPVALPQPPEVATCEPLRLNLRFDRDAPQ